MNKQMQDATVLLPRGKKTRHDDYSDFKSLKCSKLNMLTIQTNLPVQNRCLPLSNLVNVLQSPLALIDLLGHIPHDG